MSKTEPAPATPVEIYRTNKQLRATCQEPTPKAQVEDDLNQPVLDAFGWNQNRWLVQAGAAKKGRAMWPDMLRFGTARAYGLTLDEVKLMWATAPPHTPLSPRRRHVCCRSDSRPPAAVSHSAARDL
jgi:hypothetical protein